MKKLILPILVMATILSSCSKYEDGPSFTLLSKKSRAVNNWKYSAVLDSKGTDITSFVISSGDEYLLELKKDDTFSFTEKENGSTYTYSGTWAFSEDKMQLLTTDSGSTYADSLTILKLEKDEMWLFDESDSLEFHLTEVEG